MQEFKIKVTNETSEEVQNCIFNLGYSWSSGSRMVHFTEKPYVFFGKRYKWEKSMYKLF